MPRRPIPFALARAALIGASLAVLALGAAWGIALLQEVNSPNSVSGHHDFFAFYSASSLIRDARPDALYDREVVTAVQRAFFPFPVGWAGYMAYINPPFAAAAQLPLAFFREETARLVWLAISVALVPMCAALLTVDVRGRIRWLVAAVLVATFPTYQALVNGQWSPILLLGCLAALLLARRNRPTAAGICLGVLAVKPPVLLLALAWLLLVRQWRIAFSAVAASAVAVAIALPLTGLAPYVTYARYLVDVALSHTTGAGATGPSAWSGSIQNMEGLNGLATALVGQSQPIAMNALTLVGAVFVLAVVVLTQPWRRPIATSDLVLAVSAGMLLNPNLFGQDCLLALPLFPILAPRLRNGWAQLGLALAIAAVLNSAALDTMASQQGFLHAPHLPTIALLAIVAACAVGPERWRRLAWSLGARFGREGLEPVTAPTVDSI